MRVLYGMRVILMPNAWQTNASSFISVLSAIVAKVYLNGKEIAEHEGGFTPFK